MPARRIGLVLAALVVSLASASKPATVLEEGICTHLKGEGTAPTSASCVHACPGDTCADVCNNMTYTAAHCDGGLPDCSFEPVNVPTQVCRHCPCNHANEADPTTWFCQSSGPIFRANYVDMQDCFN